LRPFMTATFFFACRSMEMDSSPLSTLLAVANKVKSV
jgi:hypothetical protein